MAILKSHRFLVELDTAFQHGLLLMGEIAPDNEYQPHEEGAAGRPARRKVDEVTGKRQWKGTVTDPTEPNAKRASFEVIFQAGEQSVPTTSEVVPRMRPIELDGLTAEPKVAGNGEFKYQSYVFRAAGFEVAAASKPVKARDDGGNAEPSSKAA